MVNHDKYYISLKEKESIWGEEKRRDIEMFHLSQRLIWWRRLGKDCYNREFLNFTGGIVTNVLKNFAHELIKQIKIDIYGKRGCDKAIAEAFESTSIKIARRRGEWPGFEMKIARPMIHLKIAGLFWLKFGLNFYEPFLIDENLGEEASNDTVKHLGRRAVEISNSMTSFKDSLPPVRAHFWVRGF